MNRQEIADKLNRQIKREELRPLRYLGVSAAILYLKSKGKL